MQEFDFIRKITKGIPRSGEGLFWGVDDDAAVLEGPRGNVWLVSTDNLVEDIHFRRHHISWKDLGRKSLLVNVSDIAAMGGIPWFYFVSISIPPDIGEKKLLEFNDGLQESARKYNMILAGGDTTCSATDFFISITIVGSAEKKEVVYRRGARSGDGIFVTGNLGGSALGLKALEEQLDKKRFGSCIARHICPEPRLAFASWLAQNMCASSMIDISDGFVSDLNHVADLSGCGYRVDADKIPAFEGLEKFAQEIGLEPTEVKLTSGEEYELIFTMSKEQEEKFLELSSGLCFNCMPAKVGEIVKDKNVRSIERKGKEVKLGRAGFVHELSS